MFFKKKPMKPKIFRIFFRLKGSLESCRVAYEKTTSVPIMGFEKNTVKEKYWKYLIGVKCSYNGNKTYHIRFINLNRKIRSITKKIFCASYKRLCHNSFHFVHTFILFFGHYLSLLSVDSAESQTSEFGCWFRRRRSTN